MAAENLLGSFDQALSNRVALADEVVKAREENFHLLVERVAPPGVWSELVASRVLKSRKEDFHHLVRSFTRGISPFTYGLEIGNYGREQYFLVIGEGPHEPRFKFFHPSEERMLSEGAVPWNRLTEARLNIFQDTPSYRFFSRVLAQLIEEIPLAHAHLMGELEAETADTNALNLELTELERERVLLRGENSESTPEK